MGIYIKGMEMPKAGRLTLQISADGSVYVVNHCNITAETYTTEAVPIPPHGDLIERNAAYASLLDGMVMTGYQSRALDCINEVYAPTIIPAEVPDNNVGNIPASEEET